MKRVLTAVVLVPLIVWLVFGDSFWLITLVVGSVAELALWEYLTLADATGAKTPRLAAGIAVAALFLLTFFRPELMGTLVGAITLALLILCAFRSPLDRVLPDAASSLFGVLYIGLSLTTLPLLSQQDNGPSLLIFLLFVVWAGDTLALYIGRTWGHRKLAPAISPGKSWEGSAASIAGSLIITGILLWVSATLLAHGIGLLSFPGPAGDWFVLAAIVNIAAQVGDLVESAIKRGAGVKDSGSLLPGHGGVLDRIDALLIAAPVLWYALLVQPF
ncbi:MAG TPA: phosphatidate cytidylyltransferase [Candidatus Angelobacter sp.]|nr:phosphatidate cytidylyltransferase [Candidatus Angelobacter sp.]